MKWNSWVYISIQRFFLIALIGGITACSTSLVKYSESKPVPSARIYGAYQQYSQPTDMTSKLIVVRDGGVLGAGGSAALFVNGDLVARLRTSESLVMHIDLGDNVIGTGPGTKMDWESDSIGLVEQTLMVERGKTYYYRLGIHPYNGLVLNRSTQLE